MWKEIRWKMELYDTKESPWLKQRTSPLSLYAIYTCILKGICTDFNNFT
jgi:hypothetical protein